MSEFTEVGGAGAGVGVGETEVGLGEERDFLLRSLVDLDAELAAGDIDQHDYIALKDGYTSRAAAVLRALDHLHGAAADPAADPASREVSGEVESGEASGEVGSVAEQTPVPSRRWWVRAAVATCVAGFSVVAALLVSNGLGQRLPGGTLTGGIPVAGPEAQLAQANKDLGNGEYAKALKVYDSLLHEDPRNPVALAYRGWILFITGRQANRPELVDKGLSSIRNAEAADPGYADAHFFAGMILMSRNDNSGAAAEFQKALDSHPPPALIPVIDGQLRIAQRLAAPANAADPNSSAGPPTTR